MKLLALILCLLLVAGTAAAQPAWKRDNRPQRFLRDDERQRMREDVREVYRERRDRERAERPRPMTPEEREKLRRDIESANRELRRR